MKFNFTLVLLYLLFINQSLHATHIVGGELSLVALNSPTSSYTHLLTLNLYRDEINGNPGSKDQNVFLGIYSKRTHELIESVSLPLTAVQSIAINNSTCQTNNSLKTNLNIFSHEIYLSPSVYSDNQGYYIVWQRCCRNYIITNIKSPDFAGSVFYLEFPAQTSFRNSSPVFNPLTIDYICVGQPFSLNYSATDADGDELRYSMSTPLNGFADWTQPIPFPFPKGANNFPTIIWESGYDENNAIQGSKPLQINPQTGDLTVTASQLGLFVFGVKIEEFRNGVKIGEVRREAQMKVIECQNIEPDQPIILYKDTPAIELIDCPQTTFRLKANPIDSSLQYQWLLNGSYILQAKDSVYVATKKGEYALEVSFKNKCSNKSQSKNTKVNFHILPPIQLSPTTPSVCEGNSVQITAPSNSNYIYEWFKDKNIIINETNSFLDVKNKGEYKVIIKDVSNNCILTDSTVLQVNTLPKITLTAEKTFVCSKNTSQVNSQISNRNNTNYTYQWRINNAIQTNDTLSNIVNQAKGKYQLIVKDQNNCMATDSVFITEVPEPSLTFLKPEVICGIENKKILLKAFPPNGTFSGIGIQNNTFNPSVSKAGTFDITYQYTDNNGCTNKVTHNILVEDIKIEMPDKIIVYQKEPKKITNKVYQSNLRFEWSPQENLNGAFDQQPTAQIDNKDQTFYLKVTSTFGCIAKDSVQLILEKRIRVPTIFTPNEDGINDALDVYGIDFFPEFQISIFNRWGELVFYSKGYKEKFRGKTIQGIDLPPETYTYRIQPSKNKSDIIGVFVLKR